MLKMLSKKNEENILELKEYGKLPLLKYPLLEQTGIVEHCFTTRLGGVSQGCCSSLNLSFTRGDDVECVLENFRRVGGLLGIELEQFVCSNQTHTTNIRLVTKEDAGKGIIRPMDYENIDGLITNESGICLSLFFADCVPVYFFDPVNHVIGLAHSGWKGTVDQISAKMLMRMKEAFGTTPQEVLVVIGPSICQDCYEVSEDVAIAFQKVYNISTIERTKQVANENAPQILSAGKSTGKYQLNLWEAIRQTLTKNGVLLEHIQSPDICTCCNPNLLFSHRASGGKRGNLGAFMMLNGD